MLYVDFRIEPFPVISKLISKADKIKLMKVYVFNCFNDAKFPLLIVEKNPKKFSIGF